MATILENEIIRTYFFYSSILVVKVLSMSILTSITRGKTKAFANPEDGATLKIKPRVDDRVERIRRAHLNDLENILPFFVIGFIYTLTNPAAATASLLFRVFTVARFAHTLVYAIYVVPQPARALSFAVALAINFYMAITSICHFA